MNQRATRRNVAVTLLMVDRSPATCRNGDNLNDDHSDDSGDRLRQNSEKATGENGNVQREFILSRPEQFDLGIIST